MFGHSEIWVVRVFIWSVAATSIALSGFVIGAEDLQQKPVPSNYSDEFLADANNYNISNRVVDIFFFTQYCGPSNRVWKQITRPFSKDRVTYDELDVCCLQHDKCENFVLGGADYDRYPGLPPRSQFFARMQCMCDGLFYKCLHDLNSRYASAVAIGYGIVQSYCFEFEHPIVKCTKRSFTRCEEYSVDSMKPKTWQWFDVPPAYKHMYDFPRTINP